jgi:hypothetical protein
VTPRQHVPEFNWSRLTEENVEPAIRGNIVMLSMQTSKRPLDIDYIQKLTDRLQAGLNQAKSWRTTNEI